MLDKKIYAKTEGRLYRYFRDNRELGKLKSRVSHISKRIETIMDKIKNNNVTLEEESKSIIYEERVQTSSNGTSYAERELIRQIERLELELGENIKKKGKLEYKIREIEEQISVMENNLSSLNEESKRFVECKYGEGKSIDWIAVEMFGGARSTAYRKKDELIESIAQWSNFIK
ncbi:hypothetical protein [Clostridium sp. L74]|uniref:hypothetical protein n=1 Tax=Clostridium sp. L74 TaxID=1560217 RepID=UPI0006ABA611|nr:hypothetical protein [Clostridium sp. L74]KOR24173.1 hypothetical protein ND00_28790 [Clostridium sp. L74]